METLKDQIVWTDPIVRDSKVTSLGTADKLFNDCEHLFVTKNVGKRVTIMFKNANGKVRTVVASEVVDKLIRQGIMSQEEALSLPVLKGEDRLDSKTNTMQPTFWLSLPGTGWVKVSDVKVVEFTKVVDYNKLAVLD